MAKFVSGKVCYGGKVCDPPKFKLRNFNSDFLDNYKDFLTFDYRFGTVSASCVERCKKNYKIQQFYLFLRA